MDAKRRNRVGFIEPGRLVNTLAVTDDQADCKASPSSSSTPPSTAILDRVASALASRKVRLPISRTCDSNAGDGLALLGSRPGE